MTSFEVFKNKEFGKLILLKINEKEFFIGRDIAFKLGYTDPNGAMRRNVSNENKETVMLSNLSIWKQLKKELDSTDSRGHQAKRVLLTENGVYELINAAKHPKGNKLKKRIKEILKTTEIEVDDNCNTSVILNKAETKIIDSNHCLFEGYIVEMVELDGEILFNANDVAELLGIKNIRENIRKMNDNQVVKLTNSDVKDIDIRKLNNAGENFLTESGLYKLAFRSNKESAERFTDWVAEEVLPSIRKHGAYMTPNALQEAINNPDFTIGLLEALKKEQNEKLEEQNKRIEAENKANVLEQEKENLSNVIAEVTPKVKFSEEVLETNDTMTARQIAADYGLSAEKLNKILQKEKIQYKCNGQWILYQKYKNKGYEDYKTGVKYGHSFTQMVWTQKGRMFIHQVMTEKGYKTTNKINKLETENNQMEMNLGE